MCALLKESQITQKRVDSSSSHPFRAEHCSRRRAGPPRPLPGVGAEGKVTVAAPAVAQTFTCPACADEPDCQVGFVGLGWAAPFGENVVGERTKFLYVCCLLAFQHIEHWRMILEK